MLYKLTYRVKPSLKNNYAYIKDSINRSDNRIVQRLSWSNGHYIIKDFIEGNLEILVAFPSIFTPYKELIKVQEYILDRLNIEYTKVNIQKWIEHKSDDIIDSNLDAGKLIVRRYYQDYFFKEIIKLSQKYFSHNISTIFYKNYYLEGFYPTLFKNLRFNKLNILSDMKDNLKLKMLSRISSLDKNQLPIFQINDIDSKVYEYKKYLLIKHLKEQNDIELKFIYKTLIKDEQTLKNLEHIQDVSFANALTGQVWEIVIDVNMNYSNLINIISKEILYPKIIDIKSRGLVIIKNPQNYNLRIQIEEIYL